MARQATARQASQNIYIEVFDPATGTTWDTGTTDLNTAYAEAKAGTYGTPGVSNVMDISIPPGIFDITPLVHDTPHLRLRGAGQGQTELRGDGTTGGAEALVRVAANDIEVADLTIHATLGNAFTQRGDAVIFNAATDTVKNCRLFTDAGGGAAAIDRKSVV